MGTRLADKVAIVTGSGQGIGRATAIAFAAEGATVIIATRTPAHGEETLAFITAAGGKAVFRQIDIGDHAASTALVHAVAAEFGRLDIIVHNAAAFGRHLIAEMDDNTLDLLLNVNLKACFTLARASYPYLKASGAGRFLVTSSVTGPKVTMPGSGAYAASKAGVTGFIHTAALEWAEDDITVNAIEPGYIDTAAIARFKTRFGPDGVTKYIPAKRFGRPDEIATVFVFLASADASYVTGETIVVDGGARLPESPVFIETGKVAG